MNDGQRWRCVLAVVVLAGIALGGCGALRGGAEKRAADDSLTVVTFNVRVATDRDGENRWEKRREFAADVIEELSPDVLGIQEALIGQVEFLQHRLTGYQRFGVGRNDGKRDGEFAAVFVRKGRFEVKDSGTFWLSETPDEPGSRSWDAAYPRIVTWVRAVDRRSGRPITFLNTHWDNRGRRARLESAKQIKAWIVRHVHEGALVLTGDFNSPEDSEQIQRLLDPGASPRLFDAYRFVHPQRQENESTGNRFFGRLKGPRVDQIFHTGDLVPLRAEIVRVSRDGRYPSDHYPVKAVLRWKGGK